jgi:glycosyltransferase involved in cell wall biosynthesis
MTVYNEADYIDFAIRGCLPHVDHLVIVEGAYQETIALGKPPRSNDGTLEIIQKYTGDSKVQFIQANERSDKDQRNIGLAKIKELNPDGWMLIVDGDEVYKPETFKLVVGLTKILEKNSYKAAYFKSLTFVNDLDHYTEQEFPRLFKLTPECHFTDDNFMKWADAIWAYPSVIKLDHIKYYHYSFVKNRERTELKKKWWETRFQKLFAYGWDYDERGFISDKGHKIYEFKGQHPEIMRDHIKMKGKSK